MKAKLFLDKNKKPLQLDRLYADYNDTMSLSFYLDFCAVRVVEICSDSFRLESEGGGRSTYTIRGVEHNIIPNAYQRAKTLVPLTPEQIKGKFEKHKAAASFLETSVLQHEQRRAKCTGQSPVRRIDLMEPGYSEAGD